MRADEEAPPAAPRPRPRLWFQIVLMAAFYGIYSYTRNLFGSALVDEGQAPEHAFSNAMRVIDAERFLHIFHEATIQSWFLGSDLFIRFWNIYYGTFHFVVTLGAFFWMYLRAPARFTQWRNVLAFTTALGILGFSLFPLMPPRLLDADPPYGGAALQQQHHVGPFGFEDTLAEVGGLWSFDSGTMAKISNQYAAMPSLHIAWSTWCTCALWPLTRRRWIRVLLVLYPLATLFCIVVTANHYFLDAVGGLVCLAVGYVAGTALDTWWHERRTAARRLSATPPS
jgi:PAP2 superfamily